MKKRTIALLTLLVVWSAIAYADFATNGGWIRIFYENKVVTAPVDTVLHVDTIRILNVTKSRLEFDSTEWTTPVGQWTKLTFFDGSNKDTIRYGYYASPFGAKDSIFIRGDSLPANTASTDSVIVAWYSNIVKVDTSISVALKEAPSFTRNAFLARALNLSNLDSTGLTYIIQHRVGDNGTWATVATLGLMTEADSSVSKADTLASANLLFGNQWRVLRVFVDSVGGTVRRTNLESEVWWRGIR